MRVEEAATYWTAYSLPAFIGCFMCPWNLSSMQLFQVQNVQRHLLSGDILALWHKVVLASPETMLKSKMLFTPIKGKYSFELRYLKLQKGWYLALEKYNLWWKITLSND